MNGGPHKEEHSMWVKGTLLGFVLLAFETGAFIYYGVYRNMPPSGTFGVDVRVFAIYTIRNPWWWAALVATFIFSYWLFRARNT
jgi:hypothetical protein